jgi:carboxymethylenebutenolidase
VAHQQTSITTDDGSCPLHVFTPAQGDGPWPAAILYMDALAIRPTLFDMGQRLADAGYVVLLPDLFYRYGDYGTLDPQQVFASDNPMAVFGPLMASTDKAKVVDDTRAMLAYLDTRDDIAGTTLGVVGYCMGGGMALTVAGAFPDRVAAAASFHGGGLATDAADSPHRQAPYIKAKVLVAGADNDDYYPPEMAERLAAALDEAGVDHRCEIYPGAAHGWTMADFPVYNETAAERHWRELIDLFDSTLK